MPQKSLTDHLLLHPMRSAFEMVLHLLKKGTILCCYENKYVQVSLAEMAVANKV